jgi:undecaprenyl-diphosphatase
VDLLLLLKAMLMGLVEGATELIPVSSTGHLILAGQLLNFWTPEKRVVFEIFIQMGAMMAVLWEYRVKIFGSLFQVFQPGPGRNLYINLVISFFPAALIGLFLGHFIQAVLFNAYVVAAGFIVGGIIIIWIEKRSFTPRVNEIDNLSYGDALKVGLCQCLALIPGVSRSGATIIGGMYFGLSRKTATEFSFFLAIPMLSAASLYSLWSARDRFEFADVSVLAVGFITAFIATFVVMKVLLKFVANHTFIGFAWYRILFGILIIATAQMGWVNWSH